MKNVKENTSSIWELSKHKLHKEMINSKEWKPAEMEERDLRANTCNKTNLHLNNKEQTRAVTMRELKENAFNNSKCSNNNSNNRDRQLVTRKESMKRKQNSNNKWRNRSRDPSRTLANKRKAKLNLFVQVSDEILNSDFIVKEEERISESFWERNSQV